MKVASVSTPPAAPPPVRRETPMLLPSDQVVLSKDAGPAAFSVARLQNGAWTLLDPQGNRFFSTGINCVYPTDSGGPPGPKYDGLAEFNGDVEKWSEQARGRMQAWNFNTVGGWSSLRAAPASQLPYALDVPLIGDYSMGGVFEPDFEATARKWAAGSIEAEGKTAATLDADSSFLGYYTDNELNWGWNYSWRDPNFTSVFENYANQPADSSGKKAWASYMAETYDNDFERISKVWNVDVKSADDLLNVSQVAPRAPEHAEEAVRVGEGFLGRVADRYYEVTSRVMKELLPHHLNLGSRLTPSNPKPVLEAAGKYCDVLSFNMYTKDLNRFVGEVTRLHEVSGGKPVLITEFSYPARDNHSGNTNAGYEQCTVATQQERARTFAAAAAKLSRLPFVVGYQWFQYFDEPTNGRADGECCNFGLVDLKNQVYEDLAKAATVANAGAQKIASSR